MLGVVTWANGNGTHHPLARALRGAGLDIAETAARLGVDPKTVGRWLAGRIPYPRNRAALIELTGWTAHDLWPDLARAVASEPATEVRAVYPSLAAIPVDTWRQLLVRAETEVSIITERDPWPVHDPNVWHLLGEKARAGVRVRVALRPCTETNEPMALPAYVRGPGIDVRVLNTVMYTRIYRADDELLVGPAVYGVPTSQSPILHLRRIGNGGVATTYLESFERIWTSARQQTVSAAPL